MRKIWWINHYASLDENGGSRRHVIIGEYLGSKYSSLIIAGGSHINGWADVSSKKNGVREFVKLPLLRYRTNGISRKINMIQFCVYLFVFCLFSKPRPSFVIGSSVHPFGCFVGLVVAKIFGAKFIYEIRDIWPLSLVEFGLIKSTTYFYRALLALELLLLKNSDAVVGVMPGIKHYCDEQCVTQKKVFWVPNGISESDLKKFSAARYRGRKYNTVFRFGYFGSLGKTNDVMLLIEAMHILKTHNPTKDFEFQIWGKGVCKEKILDKVNSLGLVNVSISGPVPRYEIPKLAQNLDCLLAVVADKPNLYKYGVSLNKLVDYHALGIPILIFGNCMNNPVELSGAGIAARSLNPTNMSKTMVEMMEKSDIELIAFGKNGVEFCRRQLRYRLLSKRYEVVLNSVSNL